MDMTPVQSSNITHIGHDGDALHVTFSSGQTYKYAGVPAETHKALLAASSVGKFFASEIRGKYEHEKVGS